MSELCSAVYVTWLALALWDPQLLQFLHSQKLLHRGVRGEKGKRKGGGWGGKREKKTFSEFDFSSSEFLQSFFTLRKEIGTLEPTITPPPQHQQHNNSKYIYTNTPLALLLQKLLAILSFSLAKVWLPLLVGQKEKEKEKEKRRKRRKRKKKETLSITSRIGPFQRGQYLIKKKENIREKKQRPEKRKKKREPQENKIFSR